MPEQNAIRGEKRMNAFREMQLMPAAVDEGSIPSRITNRSSPTKAYPKPRITSRSPMKSPRKRGANSATTRLYKAPQASIRNDSFAGIIEEKNAGNTRRRRRESRGRGQQEGTGFSMERQQSDSSLTGGFPDPPPLWQEEDDLHLSPYYRRQPSEGSLTEYSWQKAPPKNRRTLNVNQGSEDCSETEEDSSLRTFYSNEHNPKDKPPTRKVYSILTYANVLQLLVLILLGSIIYDGHHKVKKHKVQIQQYDEERTHILEQMMWIDKAAKKVHKKYTQKDLPSDLSLETKDQLKQDLVSAREELEQLQLRIQLNARDIIQKRFGDKPAQVALSLNAEGTKHILIALTDDTPHAAATFLQQIDRKLWDDIHFEHLGTEAIRATSKKPTTNPLLEFVERSRGCHDVGSVALRQLQENDLHVLVLRINLVPNAPIDDGEVCFGRVLSGMKVLRSLLPETPALGPSK